MGSVLDSFESLWQRKEDPSVKTHKHKALVEKNKTKNKTKEP